jgi:membrane-associated phospholipid phosphatase
VAVKRLVVFWLLVGCIWGGAHGQADVGPYRISRHEAWAAPLTAVFAGAGWYAQSRVEPLTMGQIAALNPQGIPGFDRFNAGDWRPKAANASNVAVLVVCASPFALFANGEERKDFWKIALMGGEAGLTTFGLTNLSKGLAHRPRPYLYGNLAPIEKQIDGEARLSFFSSHTSLAATACFFGAKVFNDYHPDSKYRPWVWTAAALIPAGVGYLRVRAGRHFLSDLVTGYAVGAAVGYLVPRLHRNKLAGSVSVSPGFWNGGSGVVVNWEF